MGPHASLLASGVNHAKLQKDPIIESSIGSDGNVVGPRGRAVGKLLDALAQMVRNQRAVGGIMLRKHDLVVPTVFRDGVIIRNTPERRASPHGGFIVNLALLSQGLDSPCVQADTRALDLIFEVK